MFKTAFLKSTTLVLLCIVSGFTLFSFFSTSTSNKIVLPDNEEKFDSTFLAINSCEEMDSLILDKFRKSNYDTAKTVMFIDHFLRGRFYHSYSELTWKDNWIAHGLGKLLWWDLMIPVIPCDIIKYPMGACSQQGILFQHQLDLLKIHCSTIKFFPTLPAKSGHYAVSVYYGNSWHFYDTNQEPFIVDSSMPSVDVIIEKKLYEKMYTKKFNERFQEYFKNKNFERVQKEPFSKGKMYYFQMISQFLSHWGWALLLLLYLFLASSSAKTKLHS